MTEIKYIGGNVTDRQRLDFLSREAHFQHGQSQTMRVDIADVMLACQLAQQVPDMLKASEELMEYAGIIEERCDSVATDMARAAIAKAKGLDK